MRECASYSGGGESFEEGESEVVFMGADICARKLGGGRARARALIVFTEISAECGCG